MSVFNAFVKSFERCNIISMGFSILMLMPRTIRPHVAMPYDDTDIDSILRYAGKLTGHTLAEVLDVESGVIGGKGTKGYFGQMVERDYFLICNNNEAVPDFEEVGLELKVTPIVRTSQGYRSKERLVLGIIDYNKVPEKGFNIFLDKNSHILVIFYHWLKDVDVYEYRIQKVVDWIPTKEELRIIREDWDIIQRYVERGEAHLISERCTRFLAACTKGAGHGKDMRSQPFSDELAKQRSLSFKPSFMTTLFHTHPDVNESFFEDGKYGSLFCGEWSPDQSFSEYVVGKLNRFRGLSCAEIERKLGMELDDGPYQYYNILSMAMLGVTGRKHIKELDEAGILMKTIRILLNGTPKECMSFPAFNPDEMSRQQWESSDFLEQLDHEFLFPVFGFVTKDPKTEARKDLIFRGAFLWSISDEDMNVVRGVWEDTKMKLSENRTDFIKISDRRIAHVRPHDTRKRYDETGREITGKCFWLNSQYIKGVVKEGLKGTAGGNALKDRNNL